MINDRQSSAQLVKAHMTLRARARPNGRRKSKEKIKCKDLLGAPRRRREIRTKEKAPKHTTCP